MPRKLINEFIIPKCTGKAFTINKGQVLRVIAHEGKQVADIRFLNMNNFKEQFVARHSIALNALQGLGKMNKIIKLYSKPPWENVMLTVIDDKVGVHLMAGQCSSKVWEFWGIKGHRNCCDNFDACLKDYGLSMEDQDSSGAFNVFL